MKTLKFKGTPGPWRIIDIENSRNDFVVDECRKSVAATLKSNKEVAEADARLIAAAPELLEILQSIVNEIEGHGGQRSDIETVSLVSRLDEIAKNAKEVIKKALEE